MVVDFTQVGLIIDRYGLPIAAFAIFAVALWRRILILGSEKDRSDSEHAREMTALRESHTRELAYVEERRLEERAGRLAAESVVRKLTDGIGKVADNVDELTTAVLVRLERETHGG